MGIQSALRITQLFIETTDPKEIAMQANFKLINSQQKYSQDVLWCKKLAAKMYKNH